MKTRVGPPFDRRQRDREGFLAQFERPQPASALIAVDHVKIQSRSLAFIRLFVTLSPVFSQFDGKPNNEIRYRAKEQDATNNP